MPPDTAAQPTRPLPYALEYAARGIPVFPLHEPTGDDMCSCGSRCGKNAGKHPRTRHGSKDATTDENTIRRWWNKFPNANIGFATGKPSGLLVIDIDNDESWRALCSKHEPIISWRARTGSGGTHLFVRMPSVPVKSSAGKIADGIDIRADGGHIVLPPSLHNSGSRYEWLAPPDEVELADCPQWLLDLINPPKLLLGPTGAQPNSQSQPTSTQPNKVSHLSPPSERGWLADAFDEAGMLGQWLPHAQAWMACCPWVHEHSDGRGNGKDSSCIVYPRDKSQWGAFKCEHSHCGNRTFDDVKSALPMHAVQFANRALPPKLPTVKPSSLSASGDWQKDLQRRSDGSVVSCLPNLVSILVHDPEWDGVLAHDDFSDQHVKLKPCPWHIDDCVNPTAGAFEEEDASRLICWAARNHGLKVGPDMAWAALNVVSKRTHVHPVREYLESLEWDAVQRLPSWTVDYLGADDTVYNRAVGLRWMIAAVARILPSRTDGSGGPGCRSDCVLILEGNQGLRKSTAIAVLAGQDWFADDIGDLRNKDAMAGVNGRWIIELGELASLQKADVETVKAFLSKRKDYFRPAYGRLHVDRPRQVTFAATTNSDAYQTDTTGLRRFWGLRCAAIDIPGLERDRDQLWAEAVARYQSGEQWWLTPDEEPAQIDAQEDRREVDPWCSVIATWCESTSGDVTIERIIGECIGIDRDKQTPRDARRVGGILRVLGYQSSRPGQRGTRRSRVWTLPAPSPQCEPDDQY